MQHQGSIKEEVIKVTRYSPEFKRKIIVSALSIMFGTSFILPSSSFAAESIPSSDADQKAEILRLRQELAALKGEKSADTIPTQEQAEDNATKPAEKTEKSTTAESENALGAVVVTSRNREEIAQDVPLPITVIGGKQLDRDRTLDIQD
ncbi:MAG: hypothetical protein V4440_13580, partial [Pseudomonadota bacterium]